jgi:hypothetical protein
MLADCNKGLLSGMTWVLPEIQVKVINPLQYHWATPSTSLPVGLSLKVVE